MRRVEKPWGYEEIWAETSAYAGKILHICQGKRLSLQHHVVKDETIRVLTGQMLLELSGPDGSLLSHTLNPGDSMRIEPGRRHRMTAILECDLMEVSTPELDDVVRHQDDFGRT